MSGEVPSLSQPDSPQQVRPREARIEQRISEHLVQDLVSKYVYLSRQYHEKLLDKAYSKEKGLAQGRYSALADILKKLGQSDVIEKIDGQAFYGEPAEPIVLAPITQPDRVMTQSLLADFQRRYMLRLSTADRKPRIRIRDRTAGRTKEIKAHSDYASGINEGRYAELSSFLQTIGYGLQMDSIQQQVNRLTREIQKEYENESTSKTPEI